MLWEEGNWRAQGYFGLREWFGAARIVRKHHWSIWSRKDYPAKLSFWKVNFIKAIKDGKSLSKWY